MVGMSESEAVLIVEDDADLLRSLERQLTRIGCRVLIASCIAEARALVDEDHARVALVDYRLPDGDGPELIRWLLATGRADTAYLMTGEPTTEHVVEAMRAGSADVLPKPFELDVIAALVRPPRALRGSRIDDWRARFAPSLVGEDPRIVEILEMVRDVASTDTTVLVTGESGTGKELIARALHAASDRANGPFVAVNCASIPESLVESELFGHVRGAFTGALAPREGRLCTADGGTLFLDEIGDMPLAAQAKLLRVLQDRSVTPVGADRPVPLDLRIVTATHRDLEAMVDEGTFRADLFFRLTVLTLELPALRERSGDILAIATTFLKAANERLGRQVLGFDASAEDALCAQSWPGNVRELANTIERAVLLKREGIVTARDLQLGRKSPRASQRLVAVTGPLRSVPMPSSAPAAPCAASADNLNLRAAIDVVERQLIVQALERSHGNRSEAAALLGLNRTTLVEKLRRLV